MSNKGTIRIKENGQIIDYYPRTTYDNVINENGDNLSSDIVQLKTFKDNTEAKLENVSQNATKTEKSSINGNIIINDEEINVYSHPTTSGNKHIPSGGSSGQILRWAADGTAVWGADNNTIYTVATQTSNGLMSSTDKTKLDGIATGANNYVHPTSSGNKHVPSGGSTGQILKWSADGTASWVSDTSLSVVTTSANGLMSSTDKTKLDGIATGANKYVHPTGDGNAHIPSNGTSNGGKYLQATSTAGTYQWAALPTASTSVAGIVQLNDAVNSTSTTTAATANAVKTAYDLAASKANASHGNHVPATQTANNAVFLRNDNTWQTINPDNIGAARGIRISAATAAAANWYRIAQSGADIGNNIGTFLIRAAASGLHSSSQIIAGITYGQNPTIQQISHTRYSGDGITKARIVYHTTYASNRAYLEVYVPDATARTIEVQLVGTLGWTLLSPSTAGSIPSGYTSKEITLASGKMVTDINGTVNGYSIAKSVPSNALFTDTVYTHPTNHPASIITQDASNRFVTDTEKSTWNAKASTAVASTSANGLMSSADKTKLDGIATGANKYVHPTGDGNAHIPANSTTNGGKYLQATSTAGTYQWAALPTASTSVAGIVQLSSATNSTSTTLAATASAVKSAYDLAASKASTSVATTGANGLMSSADKTKLDGIATGANKYVHPSSHPASIITQDASNRFVTDTEKSTWNAKASTAVATTSANGLMSTTMVTKLNGIATNANNYSHPTSSGNKHVPSGGSSGQFLGWSADGTAVWSNLPPSGALNIKDGTTVGSIVSLVPIPGYDTTPGQYSFAFGQYSYATGSDAIAMGNGAAATGLSAHAEGSSTTASGDDSHAEGSQTTASGSCSHAEGAASQATEYCAHAEGWNTKAIGMRSHAEGQATQATKGNAHAEGKETVASGEQSHAEGSSTTASGLNSHAEGSSTTASSEGTHAEGLSTRASSPGAHSEGSGTAARGWYAHAEGYNTIAYDTGSHTEGGYTRAYTEYAHAEGEHTTAFGRSSHSEGFSRNTSDVGAVPTNNISGAYNMWANAKRSTSTIFSIAYGSGSHVEGEHCGAFGTASHAEGNTTSAYGYASHAEGAFTMAAGDYSNAKGFSTTAETFALHVQGRYNKVNSGTSTSFSSTNNAFVIGNGSSSSALSNAFRVNYNGAVYGLSAFNSTGADYAEYFEWLDGNPKNEDRIGRFVSLDGEKIKLASSDDDYIIGIISGNQSIIGNACEDSWNDMYIRDDFDRLQYEDVEVEHIEHIEDEETGEVIEVPVNVIEKQIKLNPDYDPEAVYLPRSERKEWGVVGMLGQIKVIDDGTCKVNGYCKPSKDGIATHTDDKSGYRVIKRINKNLIKVIMK